MRIWGETFIIFQKCPGVTWNRSGFKSVKFEIDLKIFSTYIGCQEFDELSIAHVFRAIGSLLVPLKGPQHCDSILLSGPDFRFGAVWYVSEPELIGINILEAKKYHL